MKLEELYPGSPVVVYGQYGTARRLSRVARITKTQIVLTDSKVKYRLCDGYAVGGGGSYTRWQIKPATPALAMEVVRETIINDLLNLSRDHVKTLPTVTLYNAHVMLCDKPCPQIS